MIEAPDSKTQVVISLRPAESFQVHWPCCFINVERFEGLSMVPLRLKVPSYDSK